MEYSFLVWVFFWIWFCMLNFLFPFVLVNFGLKTFVFLRGFEINCRRQVILAWFNMSFLSQTQKLVRHDRQTSPNCKANGFFAERASTTRNGNLVVELEKKTTMFGKTTF